MTLTAAKAELEIVQKLMGPSKAQDAIKVVLNNLEPMQWERKALEEIEEALIDKGEFTLGRYKFTCLVQGGQVYWSARFSDLEPSAQNCPSFLAAWSTISEMENAVESNIDEG